MVWALIGTLIRLWAVDVVGGALSEQIAWFIGWVVDHRVPVVAASITVVLVGIWWQRRRGHSPLEELQSLEDAVEAAAAAELADGHDGGSAR
jgi:hypothetical protein